MTLNVGDRFYCVVTKDYFTLTANSGEDWDIKWNHVPESTGLVYADELEKLELFGTKLIKINSEQHLLEINLRYG